MNTDYIVLALISGIVGGVALFLVLFKAAYEIGRRVGVNQGKNTIKEMSQEQISQKEISDSMERVFIARSAAEAEDYMKRMTTKN